MTAFFDFAMLPPEVNSARMYAGPGSGPMLSAASAWHGLAAELRAAALGYSSVLSELGQAWHGPASAAMAAAAVPYVSWTNTTAAQAEETATQAEAAVVAYEAAFAATVPPMVIAANRAQLMMLIATNFFGQNTAAIAATEAQYAEMWAQDAAAMYGYAGASAVASQLVPFDPPQETTDPAGASDQSLAVTRAVSTSAGNGQNTLSQLTSATPTALQDLASPSSSSSPTDLGILGSDLGGWNPFAPGSASDTTGLNGVINALFGNNTTFGQLINANIWNTIFGSGFYMPKQYAGTWADFAGLSQPADAGATGAAQGAAGAAEGAGAPLGSVGGLTNSVSASMGEANVVGPMSVPSGWTSPAPLHATLASAVEGAPPATLPQAVTASTPSMPVAGAMGGRGEGRAMPQYGFKVNFVARPPAAG